MCGQDEANGGDERLWKTFDSEGRSNDHLISWQLALLA